MVAGLLLVLHFVAVLLGQVHLPQTEVGKDEGGRGELEGLVVVLECIVVMPLRKMFSNGCHDFRFEKKIKYCQCEKCIFRVHTVFKKKS